MKASDLDAILARARRVSIDLMLERTEHKSTCDAVCHVECRMVPDDEEMFGSIAGTWWCDHHDNGYDCRTDAARSCNCGAELSAAKVTLVTVDVPALVAQVKATKAANQRLHILLMSDHAALGDALGRGPQDVDQTVEAARELRAERDALRAEVERLQCVTQKG